MLQVFILLVGCSLIAWAYSKTSAVSITDDGRCIYRRDESVLSRCMFFALLVVLVLFSGLRTVMNDTATYIRTFENKIPTGLKSIGNISWKIGSNPFFDIYQILLKTFISESGSTFVFITSFFVTLSNLLFFRKYAEDFGYTIFIYIAFTVYAFTMAAIKQTIATAIAIWSIPCILHNHRWKAALLILVAMMFHPYVVIFFAAYFFSKELWGSKTILLLLITLAAAASFTTIVEKLIEAAASIGDDYSVETMTEGSVNIFRLLVYLIVPVLSFAWRKQIRKKGSRFDYLCINLSIVSSCFMILARMGGANIFSRMANYFDIFQCLALPIVLNFGIENGAKKQMIKVASVLGFSVFYYTYYSKYSNFGADFYRHISIIELINRW